MNYKHLSSVYIGKNYVSATLNSQFFYHFWQRIADNDEITGNLIFFTQRVPKQGFFEELLRLETQQFVNDFTQITHLLKEKYQKAHKNLISTSSETFARRYINWASVVLRYGQYEFINSFPLSNYSGPFAAEIELIGIQSNIELCLSRGNQLNLTKLIALNDEYINDDNTSYVVKLKLLNYLNVNYYRHKNFLDRDYNITAYTEKFLNLVRSEQHTKFHDKFYTSIAFRGLAMATELGEPEQNQLISQAERLAREIRYENIATKENLYTCLQTLSKWFFHKNEFITSKSYLEEMISLDPYDTTGYCELGMHYFKRNDFENAAKNFHRALTLGPPAAAMNSYYCAKSLALTGKPDEAFKYYTKCIELDDQALSPYLELIEYFLQEQKTNEARNLAKIVKQTPILFEQLEEYEADNIEKLVN